MNQTIKQKLSILLPVFIIFISITGCNDIANEEKEATIKDDVYKIYEEIKSDFSDAKSEKDLAVIIKKWASKNKLSCTQLKSGNLLITTKKSVSGKKSSDTVLQCSIGGRYYKTQAEYAAIALATLKNHDISGKTDAIFTLANPSAYYGTLQDKSFISKYKHIISLNYSKKTKLFNGSAQTADYTMSLPLFYQKTVGTKAYKISISNINKNASFDDNTTHTNPLNTLGSLMSKLKSNNIIYQICDFSGGSSAGTYAQNANITVTVSSNYEDRLLSVLESEQEDFETENSDNESDAKYEFVGVDVPKESYAQYNLDSIISLFYTLDDGIYKEDTQTSDPKTIANIGKISYINGNLVWEIEVHSLDKDEMAELEIDYKKTAALCDFNFNITAKQHMWPTPKYEAELHQKSIAPKNKKRKRDKNKNKKDDKNNIYAVKSQSEKDLTLYLEAAKDSDLELEPQWSYTKTECALLYNSKINKGMILIGANIQDGPAISKSLIHYITQLSKAEK